MAYDDILEKAAAPRISAKGGNLLFKRRPGAPFGNKLSTFGNTRGFISNGASGHPPNHQPEAGEGVFSKNNKALNDEAERENKRKKPTRSEKARETRLRNKKEAHQAGLELTRRRVPARVAQYGTGYTCTERPTKQSKAAAGRRAERLSKEKNKAVNTKPAPLIVFKNDTFADLLSGKPNYIGATRIDTDLRKSNLKTLRGLPKDKHYFDDATRYKSVSEETVLVQVQKNRGRVFAKPSHTFVVLAHGQMIKPVEGEFFLALRHKPNKNYDVPTARKEALAFVSHEYKTTRVLPEINNYISTTEVGRDFLKGNLKTINGLPQGIHFKEATDWMSCTKNSVFVQEKGKIISATGSHTFDAHSKDTKPIEDEFCRELCERLNKAVKQLELFSENSERPLKRGPRLP